METEDWDYLAVGGELHGQIFRGLGHQPYVDLPLQDRRLAEYASRTTEAKVRDRLTIRHKVHIHEFDGREYAIAYLEPEPADNALSTRELEALISSTKLISI